jgi:hypothetical protein
LKDSRNKVVSCVELVDNVKKRTLREENKSSSSESIEGSDVKDIVVNEE